MDEQQNTERKDRTKAKEPEPDRPEKQQFNAFLCGLFRDVLSGTKSMQLAEKMVREEVEAMPAEEQKEWKTKSQELARRLMSVAEGFSQTIVVAGSRQWGQ